MIAPSPIFAETVSLSPNTPCSRSTCSPNHAFSRPSTIFGTACSGFPSAFVISDKRSALPLDLVGRYFFAAEVARLRERHVERDLVEQLGVDTGAFDQDAGPTLTVQVGVDDRAAGRLVALNRADVDVLLDRELEILDRCVLGLDDLRSVGEHEIGQLLGELAEVVGLGGEVGLRLEVDERSDTRRR